MTLLICLKLCIFVSSLEIYIDPIYIVAVALVLLSTYADDHDKPFYQIAEDYGFPVEEHFVTTSDGYILRLWRIPSGPGEKYNEDRKPILWQHGSFDSSDALFNHGPDLSPVFYLVNQGYDLWVSNLIQFFRICMKYLKYSLEMQEVTSTVETTLP